MRIEPGIVERMAIAGHAAFQAAVAPSLGDWFKPEAWDGAEEHVKAYYRAAARASLETLREPTDAMLHAAWCDRYKGYGNSPEVAHSLATERLASQALRWQDLSSHRSMIDAALSEADG